MPIFEYSCESCSGQFEVLVPSPETAVACPKCGSDQVRKQVSAFAASKGDSAPATPSCYQPGCGSSGFG